MLDCEIGMKGKEADDWAMYNQITVKYEAPHQKAWSVERHKALIRSALQCAESQGIKESLRVNFVAVLGLVTFMRDGLVSINNRTPYQALLGRRFHLLPPLEC